LQVLDTLVGETIILSLIGCVGADYMA